MVGRFWTDSPSPIPSGVGAGLCGVGILVWAAADSGGIFLWPGLVQGMAFILMGLAMTHSFRSHWLRTYFVASAIATTGVLADAFSTSGYEAAVRPLMVLYMPAGGALAIGLALLAASSLFLDAPKLDRFQFGLQFIAVALYLHGLANGLWALYYAIHGETLATVGAAITATGNVIGSRGIRSLWLFSQRMAHFRPTG